MVVSSRKEGEACEYNVAYVPFRTNLSTSGQKIDCDLNFFFK